MGGDFFKFPATPHLALLGGVDVRGDKVMTAAARAEFLCHELVVEEKVDGANLGLGFDADGNLQAQNRGAYLTAPRRGQWKKLDAWLKPRIDALFDGLGERYILFGEWCYAQHSVAYTRLPDWLVAFDVYDKSAGRFVSTRRRDALLQTMQLAPVPRLARGRFTVVQLGALLTDSKLGDHAAEGCYLRLEQGDWLAQRAKLVRPAFTQAIEQHWSQGAIKVNEVVGG